MAVANNLQTVSLNNHNDQNINQAANNDDIQIINDNSINNLQPNE
jgi:hypothetical protein